MEHMDRQPTKVVPQNAAAICKLPRLILRRYQIWLEHSLRQVQSLAKAVAHWGCEPGTVHGTCSIAHTSNHATCSHQSGGPPRASSPRGPIASQSSVFKLLCAWHGAQASRPPALLKVVIHTSRVCRSNLPLPLLHFFFCGEITAWLAVGTYP